MLWKGFSLSPEIKTMSDYMWLYKIDMKIDVTALKPRGKDVKNDLQKIH